MTGLSESEALNKGLCEILECLSGGDYNKAEALLDKLMLKPGMKSSGGDTAKDMKNIIGQLSTARRTQEQLREITATRDKFFSIISHDLRSPFNAILGFSDLLSEDWETLSDTDRKSFLLNIRNTAHNTFNLLERLLEWSRIQTGKMRLLPTRLQISQLIEESFNRLTPAAERKFIRLNSEVTEESCAWADKDAILLILRNLINNAINFTPHNGFVTVSAATFDNNIVITISDNGIGISQEDMKKLFRFEEQLRKEGTDKERGSGLGLVLCKEILEKSGGSIRAESTEGKGSRFSFSLPKDSPIKIKP